MTMVRMVMAVAEGEREGGRGGVNSPLMVMVGTRVNKTPM